MQDELKLCALNFIFSSTLQILKEVTNSPVLFHLFTDGSTNKTFTVLSAIILALITCVLLDSKNDN